MPACAEVIIEMRFRKATNIANFIGEFLTRQEWEKELEILFNDMTGEDEN